VLVLLVAACARPPMDSPLLDPVYSAALGGDLRDGLAVLRQIPTDTFDDEARTQRDCLLERFDAGQAPPAETDDPFVSAVIDAYRQYWSRVLIRKGNERWLFRELLRVCEAHGVDLGSPGDLDTLVEALVPALAARGYHAITGVTQPHYELMAWKTEEERAYDVVLPETTVAVRVVFMDDFVSMGWTAFATCDRYESGGWTKPDALYCVRDAYDVDSETFAVSYLAHEGQHFADNAAFPALEQAELEYRAKLAELVLARETATSLLASFAAHTGTERTAPHSLANAWVTRDLEPVRQGAVGWEEVPVERINAAAEEKLRASTAALQAQGAETVTRLDRD
jgi:hypothetical protein